MAQLKGCDGVTTRGNCPSGTPTGGLVSFTFSGHSRTLLKLSMVFYKHTRLQFSCQIADLEGGKKLAQLKGFGGVTTRGNCFAGTPAGGHVSFTVFAHSWSFLKLSMVFY